MDTEDRCFAELAPFYALDGLSAAERQWAEAQMAEIPDLAGELAELEATVAMLAYGAPPLAIAGNLQARLFERIGVEMPSEIPLPAIQGAAAMATQALMALRSQNLRWRPYRVPRVMTARIAVDRTTRYVSALLRAEAGTQYPPHRHAGVEEIYMLSGDLWFGDQQFGPGDYIRTERGVKHGVATSQGGCLFFVRTSLDDEYDDLESALPAERGG